MQVCDGQWRRRNTWWDKSFARVAGTMGSPRRATASKRGGMSKSTEVYDYILDGLISCRYGLGERLSVQQVAAETGASRQPIMSALGRLSTQGFVTIMPQVGCLVIDPSIDEVADFFLMFQRLEGLLAELAAARRTEADLGRLEATHAELTRLARRQDGSPHAYLAANRSFHEAIHDTARSPILSGRQQNNFNLSDFFINHSIGFGEIMHDGAKEHDDIVEAIRDHDAEAARSHAEGHIEAVANAVYNAMRDDDDEAVTEQRRAG